MKNTHSFVRASALVAVLFFTSAYSRLTFNGHNIDHLIQSGRSVECISSENAQGMDIEIKNDNIIVGSFSFNSDRGRLVQKDFNNLDQQKNGFARMHSGRAINFTSNIINNNGSYMTAKEAISLEGRTSIDISQGLYVSPRVEFIGNKMKFNSCYINANELILRTNAPESYCAIIRVLFKKNSVIQIGRAHV